jgi:lysyl-tRNA synthetase class I
MSRGIPRVQWRRAVSTEYKIFPETPLCPKCKKAMTVSDVMPTMPTTGLDQDEVVYKCRCGAEAKRIVDRQRAEPIVIGQ